MKLAALKDFQNRNNVTISCLPYVIGRCRSADFKILHVNVSRNHCEIFKENSSWKIKDYSSSGTYVNGSLVGRGKSEILNDGDSIRFGPIESNLSWIFHSYDSSNKNSNDFDVKRNSGLILNLHNNEFGFTENNSTGKKVSFNSSSKSNNLNGSSLDSKLTWNKNEVKLEVSQNKTNFETMNELQDMKNQGLDLPIGSYCTKKNEGKKIQGLTKELQLVQSPSIDLEEKNFVLQRELVCGIISKAEATMESKLLENLTDLMEAEFQCTICSELFVIAVTLNCTHTFCKFCINQWKKKQKTCPICRKKITNETRSLVVDNYIDKMVGNLSLDLKKRREAIIEERNNIEPCKKQSKSKKKKTCEI